MEYKKLNNTISGLSGELFVGAELSRRGYLVTLTFGNAKAIDLMVEKNGKMHLVQVKSIQRKKSISFTINIDTIINEMIYVLVNLNADSLELSPEYFVLTGEEVKSVLNEANSNRDWVNYNYLRSSKFYNAWSTFESIK